MPYVCMMHCLCCQVLLCEETVSLLGIRQFYKLVGSTPSSTHEASSSSSSSAASKHSTSPEQGNNSVLHTDAGPATEPDAASSSAPAAAPADGGGSELPVAASPVQGEGQSDAGQQAAEQPEQQLSIAEQQLLLSLKVDALLQLLSSVSFHQVWAPVLADFMTSVSFIAMLNFCCKERTAKLHCGAGLQAHVASCTSKLELNVAGIDVTGT